MDLIERHTHENYYYYEIYEGSYIHCPKYHFRYDSHCISIRSMNSHWIEKCNVFLSNKINPQTYVCCYNQSNPKDHR